MKIKKFIALTLSCMLAVTAFTACSGSNEGEGSSEGEVTKLCLLYTSRCVEETDTMQSISF